MVIVSILSLCFFIWGISSVLIFVYPELQHEKIYCAWAIFGLVILISLFSILLLPLSDEEKVTEIIQIEKYEGIKFDNTNEYIIIHNNSDCTTLSYLDSENISHELPINKCKIIATMGNSAYILVIDIIPYRGPFKFKSIGKEYRIFLPEKNINKLLYFENQL